LAVRRVEYHSLDRPLQLRVTSRGGWESNFEGAICFLHDVTLMGCAKRPPPVDFEKDFLQEKTKYEPTIGKDYWLTSDGFLCPRPTSNVIDCESWDRTGNSQ